MANREWEVELTEFMNCARMGGTEIWVDNETVQVDVEQGSGYMREHTTAYIPIEVLAQMLRHAGFRVERQPPPAEAEKRWAVDYWVPGNHIYEFYVTGAWRKQCSNSK